MLFSYPSAQRKDQITRRRQSGAEHSAPELSTSTAVAWVWIFRSALTSRLPQLPAATAIKRLDCAPSYPQPAAHCATEPPNRAEVRSLCFSCLFRVPCFRLSCKSGQPSPLSLWRSTGTKSEYQPSQATASSKLWTSCASRRKTARHSLIGSIE